MAGPIPLNQAPKADLRKIKAVFFDIDDTFSSSDSSRGFRESRILPEAFKALWDLHRAGIKTVPVTGRPAGWCDMIARMWPVSAIVGENGAFYSYVEAARADGDAAKGDASDVPSRLVKRYFEPAGVRKRNAALLARLHDEIRREFGGAKVPSDQPFREFDLAIDYCEDVRRWPQARVQRLMEFARDRGAMAKLSSIHVNIWFGRYDKWTCVKKAMKDLFGIDPKSGLDRV
ncbi:MAG: hypothetical protein HYW49_04630, partial [Deltaproteobacteria bacterium]|nr:hypothetical protein [Deltaproteobacteria bacterium]